MGKEDNVHAFWLLQALSVLNIMQQRKTVSPATITPAAASSSQRSAGVRGQTKSGR